MKLNETDSMMGLDSSIDITHRASGFLAWRLQGDALIESILGGLS